MAKEIRLRGPNAFQDKKVLTQPVKEIICLYQSNDYCSLNITSVAVKASKDYPSKTERPGHPVKTQIEDGGSVCGALLSIGVHNVENADRGNEGCQPQ